MTSQSTAETGSEIPGAALPAPSIRRRWYVLYCALVVIAMVAFKLWAARDIEATAMFSDDYAYLNKSIYFVRGDFAMKGYPFQNVFSGVAYPFVLSPWQFFDDPDVRIFVVHTINIMLSGMTVLFGLLTVSRLVGRPSLLAPICLATFVPVYLFSFFALTENLVFALLAIAAWLATDFELTCKRRARFVALMLVLVLLPTTRQPGLAVVPAFLLLVAMHFRSLGRRRGIGTAAAIVVAALLPFWISMMVCQVGGATGEGLAGKREAGYVRAALQIINDPDRFLTTLRLALSQLSYLFVSTGCLIMPVFLVVLLQWRKRKPGHHKQCWRNYSAFAACSGALFVAACLLHLVRKLSFDPENAGFIYGRYVDPAGVLLVIGGVAAVLCLDAPSRFQAFLLRAATPLLLCLTLTWMWGQSNWSTINRSGIAILAETNHYPLLFLTIALALAMLIMQVRPTSRAFAPALLGFMLVFNCVSIRRGMGTYIRPRAKRIANSQQAAKWLHVNTPKTVRIGCDRSVFRQPSPTWRGMGFHFQALVFSAHPRTIQLVGTDAGLRECDYLFTSTNRPRPPNLPRVWTNGNYELYDVPPDATEYAGTKPPPLDRPAARDFIREDQEVQLRPSDSEAVLDYRHMATACCPEALELSAFEGSRPEAVADPARLTLAWKSCRVSSPTILLRAGRYRFIIRAEGDGCPDNPPILLAEVSDGESRELRIDPDRASCHAVDFELPDEAIVQLKLIFSNDGVCARDGRQIDKNVWVDSVILEPL